jgi:23S rRNA pseudouridine1911/1915/1917 synthase
MQHLGFALVGDTVYGKQHLAPFFHRQALQARRLGLVHPATGEACEWRVPLAQDFAELCAQAGIAEPRVEDNFDGPVRAPAPVRSQEDWE